MESSLDSSIESSLDQVNIEKKIHSREDLSQEFISLESCVNNKLVLIAQAYTHKKFRLSI